MAYIGTSPSQGVRHRYLFTATSGQTTFSGADDDSRTLSYTDTKFMDVFLNGVLLDPNSDYTATTGTSVVLTSGASAGDLLEVIAFDSFSVFSGTFGGDVTVGGALDATTATFDRASTDGTIIDLQKDGATVGLIGSRGSGTSFITLKTSSGSGAGLTGSDNRILPMDESALADNNTDLGMSSYRFKDLYLGGGVYLGGTGSANYLDDYEEGTFSVAYSPASGSLTMGSINDGYYVKIGKAVYITMRLATTGSVTGASGDLTITGLPFTSTSNANGETSLAIGELWRWGSAFDGKLHARIGPNRTAVDLFKQESSVTSSPIRAQASDMASGTNYNILTLAGFYFTD
jgi:hypothetical protein